MINRFISLTVLTVILGLSPCANASDKIRGSQGPLPEKAYDEVGPKKLRLGKKLKRIADVPFVGLNPSCSKICDSPRICDPLRSHPQYSKLKIQAERAQDFCLKNCSRKKGINKTNQWTETVDWLTIIRKHCGKGNHVDSTAGKLSNLIKTVPLMDCRNCSSSSCKLNKHLMYYCSKECPEGEQVEACRKLRNESGDAAKQFGVNNNLSEGAGMTVGIAKVKLLEFKKVFERTKALVERIQNPKVQAIKVNLETIQGAFDDLVKQTKIETEADDAPVKWDPPVFMGLVGYLNAGIVATCHLIPEPQKKGVLGRGKTLLARGKPSRETIEACNLIKNQNLQELALTVNKLSQKLLGQTNGASSRKSR